MKIVIPILAMSVLIASNGVGRSAETATGGLEIKIKFERECKIDPGADGLLLDFGRHLTSASLAKIEEIDAEATIKVQCSNNVDYNISIGSGNTAEFSGNSVSAERRMSNRNGAFIYYQIYSDASRKDTTIVGTKVAGQILSEEKKLAESIFKSKGGKQLLSAHFSIYGPISNGDIDEHKVFGRILKPQGGFLALPTGTYSDTLKMIVSF